MAAPSGTTSQGVSYVRPGNFAFTARAMRTSGPQQFDTENFNAGGVINVQKNLPLLQPLAHVVLRLRGRLNVTVNITDAPPESLMNLFSLIKIFGTHVALGSETPWQTTGEMAWALPSILDRDKGRLSALTINGKHYSYDEILTQATITPTFFTAAGTPYDFEVRWILPTYPFGPLDFTALQYLWDARSWGQTLQMQMTCRDVSAVGALGTTGTKTLTAFGSATGVPTIDILLDYANLGPALDASIAKAVVVRNAQFISNQVQASGGAGTRLLLLQNKKTTNVLVKTGTIETGSNNVYATLSDAILEQTQLLKNTTPIRNLQFNDMTDWFYGFREGRGHRNGYLQISAQDGEPANNPHAAIRANEWSASTQFNLVSQIVGASTNLAEAMQEYVDGDPVVAQMASGASASTATVNG
jgi:hypothetical protein